MAHKLVIDVRELTFAFDHNEDITFYLNLETGAILHITDETLFALDDEPLDEDDWRREEIDEAAQILDSLGTRYLEIPKMDSQTGYNDMVAFIMTVENDHVRELLEVAIRGKGAFRRFKDVLYNYPDTRAQWFHFKDEQMQGRVVRWLQAHDIELVN